MKTLFFLVNFTLFFSLQAEPYRNLPCPESTYDTPELDRLMEGINPVVNVVNDCEEREGIEDAYKRKGDQGPPNWPEALLENPIDCIKGLFSGLIDSVVDISNFLWSLLKTFMNTLNASMHGTYNFLKAAFTGNLSYWFSEASNGASDFINSFFESIKAIPEAIGGLFKDKVEEWQCLNGAGQSQYVCKMIGYVGGDTLITALTLGGSKLGLISKIGQGVKKTLNLKKKHHRKARNVYEDPKNPLTHIPKRDLNQLILDNVKDRRFVVETDASGHYSVRYFDPDGRPRMFDGSPFYHYFLNKKLRREGVGTNRDRSKGNLRAGEHFTVDVPPEKFGDLMNFIEKQKGTLSMACTRTACESMKATGVDIGQKPVPSIDGLYKTLVKEAETNPQVTRVPVNLTIPEQALVIDRFRSNTNIVRFNFGAVAFSGVMYGGATVATPPTMVIEAMSSHIPVGADQPELIDR